MNWDVKPSSCACVPIPGVSANAASPTARDVIRPFPSKATVTATGPAKPCAEAVTPAGASVAAIAAVVAEAAGEALASIVGETVSRAFFSL